MKSVRSFVTVGVEVVRCRSPCCPMLAYHQRVGRDLGLEAGIATMRVYP